MTLELSWQIFEKSSNIKFHENPSNGSRVVPCGWLHGQVDGQTNSWTDVTNLIDMLNMSSYINFESRYRNLTWYSMLQLVIEWRERERESVRARARARMCNLNNNAISDTSHSHHEI